jgi:hypothetical protein
MRTAWVRAVTRTIAAYKGSGSCSSHSQSFQFGDAQIRNGHWVSTEMSLRPVSFG